MARAPTPLVVLAALVGALVVAAPPAVAAEPLRPNPQMRAASAVVGVTTAAVRASRVGLRAGLPHRSHAVRRHRGAPVVLRRGAAPRARASIDGSHGPYATKLRVILDAVDGHYARVLASAYRRPTLVPDAERYSSVCGGFVGNAVACAGRDGYYVAWNTPFLRSYYDRGGGGDMAVAAVIAHEYGHLAQWQLGLGGSATVLQGELYADCMAGAFAASLSAAGRLDDIGVGDYQEAMNAMAWTGSPNRPDRSHGTAEERQRFFAYGRDGGTQACGSWLGS